MSISTIVASNGGSIMAPTMSWSNDPSWRRAPRMDVPAEDDLRSRVGAQLGLEVGAVHEVAGIREPGSGHPGRFGQDGKVRGDDDELGLTSPAAPPADVLRRRRAPADRHTGDGDPRELERLFVQQPDPVLAGALGELLAEAEIVVAAHRCQRCDVGRRETGEHVR